MTSNRGNTIFYHSSQQLPCLGLESLKLFELTWHLLRALDFASYVASVTIEMQGCRQVCLARRRGPSTQSKTVDANLDCAFVQNALVYT